MFVLGIAGGSGSGKSTIIGQLLDPASGGGVAHLPHDMYYRNRADMPAAIGDSLNWDHPDSLDNDLFAHHIDELKAGRRVRRPVYDFAGHRRAAESVVVEPLPVLLVEGILLFAIPTIRERLQLKVFIDTPADLRILRRMVRDVHERGRSVESVVDQYHATVRPMHDAFVEPSKKFADVVVPWELRNDQAVALLSARVREHIPVEDVTTKPKG
jgi:uridine kinase